MGGLSDSDERGRGVVFWWGGSGGFGRVWGLVGGVFGGWVYGRWDGGGGLCGVLWRRGSVGDGHFGGRCPGGRFGILRLRVWRVCSPFLFGGFVLVLVLVLGR